MNVRDVFFTEIYNHVKMGDDIFVVSSDIGAPSLDSFRKDYPQRFVNVGIAEQNSISVAAGLSLAGKTAITYGLNPFPVTRAFDHIRNIMSSFKIPISVTALKTGTATAEAGFSHMVLENISLLRTLRNIRIITPSDTTIAISLTSDIISNKMPRYIQFDPSVCKKLYNEKDIDFERGFVSSGNGSGIVVVTYGIWPSRIIDAGYPAKIIDCFSLPIDNEAFISELRGAEKIITIEDGIDSGGLGSMVLEILNDNNISIPVKRMSLRFVDGYPKELVDRDMVLESEGITMESIRKEILT